MEGNVNPKPLVKRAAETHGDKRPDWSTKLKQNDEWNVREKARIQAEGRAVRFFGTDFSGADPATFFGFPYGQGPDHISAKDCIPTGDQSSAFRFGDAAVLHTAGRP